MSKSLSGAQKRKKKQELEEKLCRIPRITVFLIPRSGSSEEAAGTSSQKVIPAKSTSDFVSEADAVESSDPLETSPVPMEVEKPGLIQNTGLLPSLHTVEPTVEAFDVVPEFVEQSGFMTDIGVWPNVSTIEMREYWSKNRNVSVRKPLEQLRNEGFATSFKDGRCCTIDMFSVVYYPLAVRAIAKRRLQRGLNFLDVLPCLSSLRAPCRARVRHAL